MNVLLTISILTSGFVLGLKHAIEADHVAAVSTIATEYKSLRKSSLIGALWGLGHTISLMIASLAIILLHINITARASLALEFCIGVMLIVLGANALLKLRGSGRIHMHVHQHGGRVHAHPHIHSARQDSEFHTHHGLKLGVKPLAIGMLHGFAGSGALMLLVLSTIQNSVIALVYVLIFGIGSTGGMMIMTALLGLPAKLSAQRFSRANLLLRTAAAAFSFGLGLFMTYQIGLRGNLFSSNQIQF